MIRCLLLGLLAMSACAPVYIPNLRNSPMFTKGGEFQASVQIGNGLEVQSAFAITDHFGAIADFSYINQNGFDADHPDDYHRHKLFEGGLGYFLNHDDSFFEVFAGYGQGQGSSYDQYDFFGPQSAIATGRYNKYFLQPAFGINKDEMNFAFVPRISMVDFYEFSTELSSSRAEEQPKFFFEPAVVGRANFAHNRLFCIFQLGVSLGMSQDIYFERRALQASLGLGLRIGGVKKLVSRL